MRLQTRLLRPLTPLRPRAFAPTLALVALGFLASQGTAQAPELTELGERIVGAWEAEDSRHEFEWGVGNRIVKSRSYWPDGDGWRLVSEGFFWWDPAAASVRGRIVAVGMGVDLFELTTRVDGDRVVHELLAHGDLSGNFVETWIFEGPDTYRWSLDRLGGALPTEGRYRRVR